MSVQDDVVAQLGQLDVPREQRARAIHAVASAAVDAEECAMLLDMLGLRPQEGLRPARPLRSRSA